MDKNAAKRNLKLLGWCLAISFIGLFIFVLQFNTIVDMVSFLLMVIAGIIFILILDACRPLGKSPIVWVIFPMLSAPIGPIAHI